MPIYEFASSGPFYDVQDIEFQPGCPNPQTEGCKFAVGIHVAAYEGPYVPDNAVCPVAIICRGLRDIRPEERGITELGGHTPANGRICNLVVRALVQNPDNPPPEA